MNEVREFLEKGNFSFEDGFQILKKYCSNEGIVSLVAHRKSLKYLTYELAKLSRKPFLKPVFGYVETNRQSSGGSSSDVHTQVQETPPTQHGEGDEIVDWQSIEKHHQNTKYDDMPNDYLKSIYKNNMDLYKELQFNHTQMKQANSDEGRANFRKEVLRLDEEIRKNWAIIDEEIEHMRSAGKEPDNPDDQKVNQSTLRSFVNRHASKSSLTNEEIHELRQRLEVAKKLGMAFSDKTMEKLKKLGVLHDNC